MIHFMCQFGRLQNPDIKTIIIVNVSTNVKVRIRYKLVDIKFMSLIQELSA